MMLFLLLTVFGVPQGFDHEVDFASRLRSAGLYRIAEAHCVQLLDRDDLSPEQRVDVTVELSKTLVAWGLNSRSPEQSKLWTRTFTLIQDEKRRAREPGHQVLLQVQLALTWLERAEWTRREAEVRSVRKADWEQTRTQLRTTITQLRAANDLLQQPLMRAGEQGLSTLTVAELSRNIAYQLSRAYRNQAIAYADRPTDQVAALTMALKYLQPLASESVVDELVWNSRIDRIECFRLRGELERASQLITDATAQPVPEPFLGRLAAEGVRLALTAQKPQAAWKMLQSQGNEIDHPELELARIQTLVALSEEEPNKKREYQNLATQAAAMLTERRGVYWGLRGEMLIASLATKDSQSNDTELLENAANTLLKQDLPEQSTEMFLRAAQQAEENGQLEKAFEFRHKAAIVEHREGNLQPAVDMFRDVARRFPEMSTASDAHLTAIFDGAALYQQDARNGPVADADKSLRQYDLLLVEHLELWPHSPSSHQARIWLGRLREAQQRTDEALQLYQQIPAGTQFTLEAYRRIGNTIQRLHRSGKTLDASAIRQWMKDRLTNEVAGPNADALRLELGRHCIDFSPRDYEVAANTLRPLLADTTDDLTRQQAVAVHVVAASGLGQSLRAKNALLDATPLPPSPILTILRGLQPIRDLRPLDSHVVELATDCLNLLKSYSSSLSEADKLVVEQFAADIDAPSVALGSYQELAEAHPQHQRIQWRYAQLLSQGKDRSSREAALAQWRVIVQRSRPRSYEWFRGKLGVAQSLFDLGEHEKTKELVTLLRALYPSMGGDKLKASFDRLLARCESD